MTSEVYRWSELTRYLRQEQWTAFDAAHILSDVDPDLMGWEGRFVGMHSSYVESQLALQCAKVHQLYTFTDADCPKGCHVITDRREEHFPYVRRIEHAILDKLEIMFTAWPDGFQHIKKTPKQWVKWALKKRYTINWLEWALNEKLLPESLRGLGDIPSQSSQSEQVRNVTVNDIHPGSDSFLDVDATLDAESIATGNVEKADVPLIEIASLFDPLSTTGIAQIFRVEPSEDQNREFWVETFSRAARNGLSQLRINDRKPFQYNPSDIGDWLIEKGFMSREKINRVLSNNLPHRSRDSKNLITGTLE